MEHKFERYVAGMQRLLDRYGYAIVAGAVLADSIGIPIPGQTVVIAGAVEASQRRMNIIWLFFIVAASATLGNTGGYALGRWGGDVLLNKLRLSAGRQKHMEDIFSRRGGLSLSWDAFWTDFAS
jgi:membrane protein DedA with SNARE-associated domain